MSIDPFAHFIPLAIGGLVIGSLALIAGVLFKTRPASLGYKKSGPLLSAAEKAFYQQLSQATADSQVIFTKVRIADVLKVEKTKNRGDWQVAFNKISAKHFDFVLCNNETFDVLAVIELDDKSHNSEKAKKRDNFVNTACETAELPMIRIKASNSYDVAKLKIELQRVK